MLRVPSRSFAGAGTGAAAHASEQWLSAESPALVTLPSSSKTRASKKPARAVAGEEGLHADGAPKRQRLDSPSMRMSTSEMAAVLDSMSRGSSKNGKPDDFAHVARCVVCDVCLDVRHGPPADALVRGVRDAMVWYAAMAVHYDVKVAAVEAADEAAATDGAAVTSFPAHFFHAVEKPQPLSSPERGAAKPGGLAALLAVCMLGQSA